MGSAEKGMNEKKKNIYGRAFYQRDIEKKSNLGNYSFCSEQNVCQKWAEKAQEHLKEEMEKH